MRNTDMKVSRRATIKQVAQEANVSIQTISRVINNRSDVSAATRERVLEIIARLDYRPNAMARGLVHQRSHTLGIVGTGLEFYGPTRTLVGIERQANEYGYSVLLSMMHKPEIEDIEPVLTDLLSRQVDGIIWAVPEIGNNRRWVQHHVPRTPVPVVFLTMGTHPDLPIVALDNRTGGRIATEHLIEQGYRHIGLLTGPLNWWEAQQRKLGWHDALSAAGIPVEGCQIVEGNWNAAGGAQGIISLLEQYPDIDSVFASNDQMALGVLNVAYQRSLRIPQDLAVVGFDDIPESAYLNPTLTTVRQDSLELGATAVRMLTQLIGDKLPHIDAQLPHHIWLQPNLVVRQSSIREVS